MLNSFARDNDFLMDQLIQIQYYCRGSLNRDDLWQLTPYERDKYLDFINKKFEEAGELIKKQIPVFL